MINFIREYFARKREAEDELSFVRGYAYATSVLLEQRPAHDEKLQLVLAYGALDRESSAPWTRGVQTALRAYQGTKP